MCANSSRWTDKCGVTAIFNRLTVETRAAKYNHWAGAAMDANITYCKYVYINTYIQMIRYKRINIHTLTLYKEINNVIILTLMHMYVFTYIHAARP